MGWLTDLLKEYPALAIAKERLALVEERFKSTEAKNQALTEETDKLRTENEQPAGSATHPQSRNALYKETG